MDNLNPNQNFVPSQPMTPPPVFNPQPSGAMKKKNYLFLITVLIILAIGAVAWWYVSKMPIETAVIEQPKVNKEAREDINISNEIQSTDLGDLDKEFNDIDKDLNTL